MQSVCSDRNLYSRNWAVVIHPSRLVPPQDGTATLPVKRRSCADNYQPADIDLYTGSALTRWVVILSHRWLHLLDWGGSPPLYEHHFYVIQQTFDLKTQQNASETQNRFQKNPLKILKNENDFWISAAFAFFAAFRFFGHDTWQPTEVTYLL